MEKLINITASQYRCPTGECPAVYKFYGDEFYGIIGKVVNDPDLADRIGEGEAAVEISADLLLSSLGIADLIEAAEQALEIINETGALVTDDDEFAALRSVLTRIQGGDGNG